MKAQETFTTNNPLRKCESTLTSLALSYLSVWRRLHGLVRMKTLHLRQRFVLWAALVIQPAYLNSLHLGQCLSKRYLVGIALCVAGTCGVFPGLFFDSVYYDHAPCKIFGITNHYSFETNSGWCFMSWFVLMQNVGVYIAVILWSVAAFLFIPRKFSGISFTVFSFLNVFGWVKLTHILFFARSQETFNAFPAWQIIVLALGVGFGIMLSISPLLYWENHKKRGNWQRWPAVHKADIDQALKNKLFDELTEEYYKVNRMI